MTYILSMDEQLLLFCKSLGFGFLMGVGYDVFGLLRLVLSRGKGLVVWEIAYAFVAAVCSFLFDLTLNGGNLRLYMLAAECLGFALWYFVAGVPFRLGVRRILRYADRAARKIARPADALYRKVQSRAQCEKIKLKKVLKKTNVLLKFPKQIVYTLKR